MRRFSPLIIFSLTMYQFGFYEALLLLGAQHNNNIVNDCYMMKYNKKDIISSSLQQHCYYKTHSYKVAHKTVIKLSPRKDKELRQSAQT